MLLAVFGSGLHPADYQVLTNLIDRGMDLEEAVLAPRVGYFSLDSQRRGADDSLNVVDPRFPAPLLCRLRAEGLSLTRGAAGLPAGRVDTGFPVVLTVDEDNGPRRLQAMTPEWLDGLAAGF